MAKVTGKVSKAAKKKGKVIQDKASARIHANSIAGNRNKPKPSTPASRSKGAKGTAVNPSKQTSKVNKHVAPKAADLSKRGQAQRRNAAATKAGKVTGKGARTVTTKSGKKLANVTKEQLTAWEKRTGKKGLRAYLNAMNRRGR